MQRRPIYFFENVNKSILSINSRVRNGLYFVLFVSIFLLHVVSRKDEAPKHQTHVAIRAELSETIIWIIKVHGVDLGSQ